MYITYYKEHLDIPDNSTQLTFDSLFNDTGDLTTIPDVTEYNCTKTPGHFNTFTTTQLSDQFKTRIRSQHLKYKIFANANLKPYANEDMRSHYTEFQIPKHSGGMRTINAPDEQLKSTLKTLTTLLSSYGILPHNSAYAYINGRAAKDAVMRHQKTGHEWFLKIDLHDFFGSCSKELIMSSLVQIPFFTQFTAADWEIFLHAAMLNDGLPQGTPLSPWLTNQVMLPFDFIISRACHAHNLTYTRYADDMLISGNSKEALQYGKAIIEAALKNTGLEINDKKTRISSIYGQNWMLGLMLNKDKQVTVGWKKKERFRATLFNFLFDPMSLTPQACSEFMGLMNYYEQIEPEYFHQILNRYTLKFRTDPKELLISRIKGANIEG